ncbi:MBL fold metallo-hydrolase [Microbacterium trichothecenolyticum]|uniref:MBL fold metallo-hydrolase n=1 Tax=Microbacterium trichothecenolyticum TaxID=69370 RepID=UPI0035BE7C07
MQLTRIGGPTILVEIDDWRILIDPTFDPPQDRYPFALGASSVKTRGPAIDTDTLGHIDLILLSHDHHADNLDTAGRALLPGAGHILTTRSGAQRLNMPHAEGISADQATLVEAPGKEPLRITGTPARHGPPLSTAIVGDVVGFTIRRQSRSRQDLWITGDTVLTRRLRDAARRLEVDVAIINAGGVQFPITGPIRYTMTGADAVKLVADLQPRVAVPAHYDGWSHFRDGEDGMRTAIREAPADVRGRFRWLPDAVSIDLNEETTPPERTAP